MSKATGILGFFRRWFPAGRALPSLQAPRIHIHQKRMYASAATDRLSGDFAGGGRTSADAELYTSIRRTMDRARILERDNALVNKYLSMVENNVLGENGIALQSKVQMQRGGKLNKPINDGIEAAWKQWGKRSTCCADKKTTWRAACRLVLRSAVRDGGGLVRIYRGVNASGQKINKFAFTLRLLEIDMLDETLNAVLPNGNEVRMGVEVNADREPIAYHIIQRHPGDIYGGQGSLFRERVPAADIIHVYRPLRSMQTRGISWLAPVMPDVHMLDGYEKAELVRQRVGACRGVFITDPPDGDGAAYEGSDGEDEQGNQLTDVEPGMVEYLGRKDVKVMDFAPSATYGPFIKERVRRIASGVNVSYNGLANDLENVNYSSIRAGVLDEREEWKSNQEWFIEDFVDRVFEEWLKMAVLVGIFSFPVTDWEALDFPEWKPRRWTWVDPKNDIEATLLAIKGGLTSRQHEIASQGRDIEEIDMEQQQDKEMDEEYGLDFTDAGPAGPGRPVESAPGEADAAGEATSGKPVARNRAALNKVTKGCLMAMAPEKDRVAIHRWIGAHIPTGDLVEAEDDTHLTLLYGFTPETDSKKVLASLGGSLEVELGAVKRFPANAGRPDTDCLVIEVKSGPHEINAALKKSFDTSSDYPDYKPHVTLAYVKPGSCSELDGNSDFDGVKMVCTEFEYSDADKQKTTVVFKQPVTTKSSRAASDLTDLIQVYDPEDNATWILSDDERDSLTEEEQMELAEERYEALVDETTEDEREVASPDLTRTLPRLNRAIEAVEILTR